jgi:hypothetical protein
MKIGEKNLEAAAIHREPPPAALGVPNGEGKAGQFKSTAVISGHGKLPPHGNCLQLDGTVSFTAMAGCG